MENYSLTTTASCAAATSGSGQLLVQCDYTLTPGGGPATSEVASSLYLLDGAGQLVDSQPASRGGSNTFSSLADGGYTVEWRELETGHLLATGGASLACGPQGGTDPDPGSPGGGGTTPPPDPITGCQDEYADDYNPAATVAGSCTYTPRWRSAWGPLGMAVRVAAVAGQVEAFVVATLRVGFRSGHPLAEARPLVDVATLRATVGPDGYATFVLAPYVRPLLGAPDGAGGYRLDLNTQTVDDSYVGYELRRTSGELLEHGYAVNAAVPDSYLAPGFVLTAFAQVPTWPGFVWKRAELAGGLFGTINELYPAFVTLPCPPNPLPVAWLNPQGDWDLWVFQGRPALADVVSDGQRYQEAGTGESRYSERGQARRTYTASSGPFRGAALAEGLATLARSPQVWVMPVVGGPWVPVTLEAGTFPVRQWGVTRTELKGITFTEAAAQYAQGQ